LNAFLEVYEEEARQLAGHIDQKLRSGNAGRLAGMVVGLKDMLCYRDHRLQASSNILNNFVSLFTATAVQRLINQDAIIIGRLNCDEFGMGSTNENSAFGPVLNPLDNEKVPGGSSGASAAAVQANLCTASIGSDTGGSIRQPASFCGVVGLKPTYSRISRQGLIAYASSFDTIGILANTVEDNALLLEIVAGKDQYDSTVYSGDIPILTKNLNFSGHAKIAYIEEAVHHKGLSPEVRDNFVLSLNKLKGQGHKVDIVSFPLLKYILPTYYVLTTAEASSNLARYDGVRYGHRSARTVNTESMYKKTRSEGFGQEVKRRIMLGTFVLSAKYYDAFYTKAQKVRRLIKEKTEKLLTKYDFIALPTAPTTAFNLGLHDKDPLEMYLADLYTVLASLTGMPAISLPNGFDREGLPFGLQLVANLFEEKKLLAFARTYNKYE
jgi:aspartyl-tRNA(Asn)/glutamyl-tRNA(Gln) amidotransferase subunit A